MLNIKHIQNINILLIWEIMKYQWDIQGKGKSTITDKPLRTARTSYCCEWELKEKIMLALQCLLQYTAFKQLNIQRTQCSDVKRLNLFQYYK